MNLARGIAVLLALCGYRLARCAVAVLGLAEFVGTGWAVLLVLLAAAVRFHWLIRLGAFCGLWLAWHWPWWAAAVCAAPRLLLVLPGLVTTLLARWRHARPRWTPVKP